MRRNNTGGSAPVSYAVDEASSRILPTIVEKLTRLRVSQAQQRRAQQEPSGFNLDDHVSSENIHQLKPVAMQDSASVSTTSTAATDSSISTWSGTSRYTISNGSPIPPNKTRLIISAQGDEIRRPNSAESQMKLQRPILKNLPIDTVKSPPRDCSVPITETQIPQPSMLRERHIKHSLSSTHRSASLQRERQQGPPPTSFPRDFYARGYSDDQPGLPRYAYLIPPPAQPPVLQSRSFATRSRRAAAPSAESRSLNSSEDFVAGHLFSDCMHSSSFSSELVDPDCKPRAKSRHSPPEGPSIYTSGPCLDCDTASRRKLELKIVATSQRELSSLMDESQEVLCQLDDLAPSASSPETSDVRSALAAAGHRGSVLDLPLDLDPSVDIHVTPTPVDQQRIDELCDRAEQLDLAIAESQERQERQVKQAWAGFVKRWGSDVMDIPRGGYWRDPRMYLTIEDEEVMVEQMKRRLNALEATDWAGSCRDDLL